jgi:hypothetical protein
MHSCSCIVSFVLMCALVFYFASRNRVKVWILFEIVKWIWKSKRIFFLFFALARIPTRPWIQPSRLELSPPHVWPRRPVGLPHGTVVVCLHPTHGLGGPRACRMTLWLYDRTDPRSDRLSRIPNRSKFVSWPYLPHFDCLTNLRPIESDMN